jgi:hypothetical protein
MTIRQDDGVRIGASCQNGEASSVASLGCGTRRGLSFVEHPLLSESLMRRLVLLAVASVSFVPTFASAQTLGLTIGSFGQHTSGGTTVNFTTQPIGIAECDVEMPLTFSNTTLASGTYYIDTWSASGTGAMCGVAANRTGAAPACTSVPLDATINRYTGAMTFLMNVTPVELFGACESRTRTFYFFNTTSSPDNSSEFVAPLAVEITMDADAPSAPTIAGDAAGDTSVVVSWTNPTDLAPQGGARVYFDPNGCGGDGGTSTLVAGSVPPGSPVFESYSSSISTATIPIASLSWDGATYGQRGAVAVTVLDSARNESVLSNVVCIEHVTVSGFWNQYCADRGLTVEECNARYSGCSVGLPSRRVDLGVLSVLAAVLGVWLVRRRGR